MSRTSKIRSLNKINESELKLGITGDISKSWHRGYKDSAWIYVGGLHYDLNEGDILSVFSQYGEIVNINLVRDKKTGKSKGFAFICYQDQRSTILAVDNFNGIKLVNRPIQVDHCDYKTPKFRESVPEEIRKIWEEGCAPKPITISEDVIKSEYEIQKEEKIKKLNQFKEVIPIKESEISKDIHKVRKRLKKEKKERKKLEKRAREREKRLRSATPVEEKGRADDEGRWDEKKKKLDELDSFDDQNFYSINDHFQFGNKKRKDVPAAPTHNVRPDFNKADWREIELFKIAREQERKEKGEVPVFWKEEEHYVPKRLANKK